MTRNEGKGKSERKPFINLSNRRIEPPKSTKKKRTVCDPETVCSQEDALDRLLFIHSDISKVLRQIDELVMQAVQAKQTHLQGRKEIIPFNNALSDILSVLKPWLPRFQKAFSGVSAGAKNHPKQSITDGETSLITNGGNDLAVLSPEPTKLDLLVSPSPLVSWRVADCTVEMGKQLFALTPLPRPKTIISRSQCIPKSVPSEWLTSSNTTPGPISQFTNVCEPKGKYLLQSSMKGSTSQNLSFRPKEINTTSKPEFPSPPNPARDDRSSMFLTTPCLRTSPPKSCFFLEPKHEMLNKNFDRYRKATPYPLGYQKPDESSDSENSCGIALETLGTKFTNLLGIKPASELGNGGKKAPYESPAWFMSPPRSCTLMEPFEEKPVKNDPLSTGCVEELAGSFKKKVDLVFSQVDNVQDKCRPIAKSTNTFVSLVGLTESTPIWKEPASTVYKGRHPGENTLKRELWVKFEAASMDGLSFKLPVMEETGTPDNKKIFLDRLEEEAL